MRYYRNSKTIQKKKLYTVASVKTCDKLCLYSGEKYYAKPDLYKVFIRTSHLLLLLANKKCESI